MCLKKVRSLLFVLFSSLLLWFPVTPVYAESEIFVELSKETRSEVNIAIPHFVSSDGSGGDFANKSRDILENDLRLFELFVPVASHVYSDLESREASTGQVNYAAWSELGVQWLIKGQYEKSLSGDKYKFTFRLFDVVNEQIFGREKISRQGKLHEKNHAPVC